MSIHASAIVSGTAEIGSDVQIGPYAIIEDGVIVGDHCQIDAAAQLRRGTVVGNHCRIGSGSLISADPHFRGFDHQISSGVVLGDNNEIREYVTIHRSIEEGENTRIGAGNFLMNGSHVGHDCRVGDDNTFANSVLLGGHVEVGNGCFFGGGSVFHQFVRVGDVAMTQGLTAMSMDVPPFVIAAMVNCIAGVNSVGLKRSGLDEEARKNIKTVFREVYLRSSPLSGVLEALASRELQPEAMAFIHFFRAESTKGVCAKYRGA